MKYICENINNYNIDMLRENVSAARLEKAEKFKNPVVRLRSLAVEYALNELIRQTYPDIATPVNITYDALGKPHLYLHDHYAPDIDNSGNNIVNITQCNHVSDVPGFLDNKNGTEEHIFISLSHSGDYVACMVSDRPCGIDIEKHNTRDYKKIARRVCTEAELSHINSVSDFYDIWTLKESALKASGLGLSYDMRLIETSDIIINEIKYAGAKLSAPAEYSLSCCEALS